MEKKTLHQAGALSAAVGAIVTGVCNALHPEVFEAPNVLALIQGAPNWSGIHWGLMIGLVLMQIGFTAVMLTLREAPVKNDAGGWGLTAIYVLLVGLALWVGLFATEAAVKQVADAAKADASMVGPAKALVALGDALISAVATVYLLGIALLGVAIAVSVRYPRGMGIAGIAIGVAMVAGVGLPRAFTGPTGWTERLGFPLLAILTLAWTLGLAVLLWRSTRTPKRRR